MMKKLMFLGAGAVGYILGAKAGRERYEQIAESAQKLRSNPAVQKKVDEAKHAAKDVAGTAVNKVKEQSGVGSSASKASATTSSVGAAGAGTASTFGRGNERPDR